jgi:ligand-binding sensor domain-containing protein
VQAYTPALTFQPGDFSLLLTFTGGGLSQPTGVAIDGAGNVWAANGTSISELSPLGAAISPVSGFKAGIPLLSYLSGLQDIAIDPTGNVWETTATGVCEFSNAGALLSPACDSSGATATDINAVAIDGKGNVWVDHNALGTVVEFNNSGTVISPSAGYTVGAATGLPYGVTANGMAVDGLGEVRVVSGSQLVTLSSSGVVTASVALPGASSNSPIAVDASGNTWLTTGQAAFEITQAGAVSSYFVTYELGQFEAIALDGAGNVWTPINTPYGSGFVEFSSSGVVLSPYHNLQPLSPLPENGFAYAQLTAGTGTSVTGVGVDGSGNVWVSASTNKLGELVGIASPVVTPISTAVKNNTLGTRP